MPTPVAPKRPHHLETHGNVRIDDYYWLRERSDPDVLAYLEAENEYLNARLGHTLNQQDVLFEEIKGRIKQTDVSVPYREGTHLYYWRYEDGQEYRVYCRKPVADEAEQVTLDVNALAEGHEYCDVGGLVVSPNERLLGYAVDTVGRRQYDIRFRDLASGMGLDDVIPSVTGSYVWANDNLTIFYTRQHETTLRSFQVYRHRLGQDVSADELVYEERDETFGCGVGKESFEAAHSDRLPPDTHHGVSRARCGPPRSPATVVCEPPVRARVPHRPLWRPILHPEQRRRSELPPARNG